MNLIEMLRRVSDSGASDLHLAAGLEPRLRLNGRLSAIEGQGELGDIRLQSMLKELTNEEQWNRYMSVGDLDFAYGLEGAGRFRANYFRQARGAAAVFRRIPEEITSLEDLGIPQAVQSLADIRQGLVLVTGPTGSGKSTTLAAIIDRINRESSLHVVTIEDPVEFLHRDRRCVFSQREVGTDTESFAAAVRAAMRADADVILVGELRDRETVELALTAAEMGTLVFGTLHTNNAVKTVDRIIDVFPADQQAQIRQALADSLAAVVAQNLLTSADGSSRWPATEILFRTSGLANAIREGSTHMIRNFILSGHNIGMRSMDDSLMELLQAKKIGFDDAYRRAVNKDPFESLKP